MITLVRQSAPESSVGPSAGIVSGPAGTFGSKGSDAVGDAVGEGDGEGLGEGLGDGLGDGLGVAGVAVVPDAACAVDDAAGVVGALVGVASVIASDVLAVAGVAAGC